MSDDTDRVFESVTQLYEDIFTADPLLLQEDNQAVFGNQILKNLLVERAISTTDPTEVDLRSTRSREKFKSPAQSDPSGISQTIKDAYLESRRHRSPIELSGKQLNELKRVTMVANPSYTIDRLPRSERGDSEDRKRPEYATDQDARKELEGSGSQLDQRLKIATVGYRVSISKLPALGFVNEELEPRPASNVYVELPLIDNHEGKSVEKLRRTKLHDAAAHARWLDAILRHVKLALNRQSHFVVLPEFALPPDAEGKQTADEIKKIADDYKHEYFLFSGSRHEGIYNRGLLLSRETQDEKASTVWWHYKVASARGLGENIMGPQTVKVPGYNFTFRTADGASIEYRVLVAICYDVFDTTTFVNYLVQCADADSGMYEPIILVPSFNPAKEFVDALRDLSFVARCPVIYVNGLHGDAKLFLYGIAIADLVLAEESSAPGETAPAASRLDQSLRQTRERLHSQVLEEMQRFRAISRMYDDSEDISAKQVVRPKAAFAALVTAPTLEPVARPGDLLLVSEHTAPTAKSLVVAMNEDRLLARRLEIADNHSDVAVLTANAINPRMIAPPVVAKMSTLSLQKVVGVVFDHGRSGAGKSGDMEICDCGGETHVKGAFAGMQGLVEVTGHSAEPYALDKQFLIIGKPIASATAFAELEGRPVIAEDSTGSRYFKRYRGANSTVILESLEIGGDFAPIMLAEKPGTTPHVETVWPVLGILFERPK